MYWLHRDGYYLDLNVQSAAQGDVSDMLKQATESNVKPASTSYYKLWSTISRFFSRLWWHFKLTTWSWLSVTFVEVFCTPPLCCCCCCCCCFCFTASVFCLLNGVSLLPHPTRPVPCTSRGAGPGANAGGQPLDQLRPHPETARAAADVPPSAAVLPAPDSAPAADVPTSAAGAAAAAVPSPAARHPATLERAKRQPPRRQNPGPRLCVRACRSAAHHYSK